MGTVVFTSPQTLWVLGLAKTTVPIYIWQKYIKVVFDLDMQPEIQILKVMVVRVLTYPIENGKVP